MNTSIVQTTAKYGIVTQFFHWATAIVVLTAYTFGPGGSEQHVYAISSEFNRQLHETLGVLVFVLVIMRILWRIVDKRPDPAPLSPWMEIASRAVQSALYLLLFAVPLTAIAGAWFEGHPLTFLAGLQIPPPVGISHAMGALIANIHTWLGDAIVWLAGFHAVAAIFHHLFLKDGVLTSMLPRWIPLR